GLEILVPGTCAAAKNKGRPRGRPFSYYGELLSAEYVKMFDGPQQDQRADDRHDESGRMEHRAVNWSTDQGTEETADDRAADAYERGHPESHVIDTRHNGARDQADDEADDDRPDNMKHIYCLRVVVTTVPEPYARLA